MSLSSGHYASDKAGRALQVRDLSWFADLMGAKNWADLGPLTWVGVGDVDPLRDEGEAYAGKLVENGNQVEIKRYAGVPSLGAVAHMDGVVEQGREFVEDLVEHVRMCLLS